MDALAVVFLAICVMFLVGYLIGRKRKAVTAIGRQTYIRFYPNPGIGISLFRKNIAISLVGGIELYEGEKIYSGGKYIGIAWRRKWSKFSRIKGV